MTERTKKGAGSPAEELIGEFARTTDEIVSLEEFRRKLESGKRLTIKFGADVTAAFLHLGHAVNLWMMRRLQEEGHKVVFLIGDFTTRIGDPTEKSETRKIIPCEDIERNACAFIEQISKVLITNDENVFEVRRNSEWFDRMHADAFLELLSEVTHSKLVSREMFRKRIREGSEIRMHEMIYPILQGWDSVELESDLTIVGSDQLFNEMMGRFFQEKYGQQPQVIITTKITPGLDGVVKQSKSLGNYVAISDSGRNMFGRTMTLPDALITEWMRVYTTMSEHSIREVELALNPQDGSAALNPRDAKLVLARAIVSRYYGDGAAEAEEAWFLQTFSGRYFPDNAPQKEIRLHHGLASLTLLDLAADLEPARTRSDLRRLFLQGGITVDGERRSDPGEQVPRGSEMKIQLGKKGFYAVRVY